MDTTTQDFLVITFCNICLVRKNKTENGNNLTSVIIVNADRSEFIVIDWT